MIRVEPARREEFIRVPPALYGAVPHWVPPLLAERRHALSKTPFVKRARTQQWVARMGRRVVGCVSAQLDPLALEHDPGIGHFGMLAAEDRPEVFAALMGTAEAWLRGHGATAIRGPFDLSINQESGVLVDGFGTPPMMMMPHNPPYVGARLEALGYAKARDLLAYLHHAGEPLPEVAARVMARPIPPELEIRPLRLTRYGEEVRTLAAIFNDAWSGNWGFVPFTEAEVTAMAREMRPLVDPELVWFAEYRGEPVAFLVCLPNVNEAIRDLGGRLLPLGWLKLLWRLKVSGLSSARVPLMGVRKALARGLVGALVPFLMIGELRREVLARGIRQVELSWVLEDNRPMRAMAEALCGAPYKTYRIYERAL
jgi:hypothetical protein